MPFAYKIDLAKRRVTSTGTGVFEFADAMGHMDFLAKDPDFDPSFSQLADFSGITMVNLTHDQIFELSRHHIYSPNSKRAFVTKNPTQYGLARMFQSYRSAHGETGIRVFSDLAEAVAWLDGEGHPAPPPPT